MDRAPECIIDIVETANTIGNPALPAIEAVRSAVKLDDSEVSVLTCEKCGAGFAISTELGDDAAQLELNTKPSIPDEACTAQYRQVGDWVTNLGKRWFKVLLFEPSSVEVAKSNNRFGLTLSPIGLEIALDDAAHNMATVLRAKEQKDPLEDTAKVAQSKSAAAATVNLFDLTLLRQDGKTWQEEVDDRSTQIE